MAKARLRKRECTRAARKIRPDLKLAPFYQLGIFGRVCGSKSGFHVLGNPHDHQPQPLLNRLLISSSLPPPPPPPQEGCWYPDNLSPRKIFNSGNLGNLFSHNLGANRLMKWAGGWGVGVLVVVGELSDASGNIEWLNVFNRKILVDFPCCAFP